jgi:hypothetical protein|tara:strand:- start:67 stop:345 length:279 start_codon:yes stop_codon:yes gene_type:complete
VADDDKVTIVEVDRSTVNTTDESWYNKVSSSAVDKWRIVPRLLMILYGIAFYQCMTWFMGLDDPTLAQAGFVSTTVGAGAAWFGLYVGSGKK